MAILISKGGKNAIKVEKTVIDRESWLQEYIHDNPESIPLYEIDADIRLLVLAREFPTSSGPVDALGVDRDGEIYLIETKLYKNPDKRLVVAQVLDYGASLWSTNLQPDELIAQIERLVKKDSGRSLAERLTEFFALQADEADELITNMRARLKEASFRFVVLMDSLHERLKDLITFVNNNSKFSLFAVEVEHYRHESFEILIPKLFGAEAKRTATTSSDRQIWNEEKFFAHAASQLSKSEQAAVGLLYEFSQKEAEIKWGTGIKRGSFSPRFLGISARSLFSVQSSGELIVNFQWQHDDDVKNRLKERLQEDAELKFPKDYRERFVTFPAQVWCPRAEKIVLALRKLLGAQVKSTGAGA